MTDGEYEGVVGLLGREPRVAELAMLPVALSAAEHVELAGCALGTLDLAVLHWVGHNEQQSQLTDVVWQWWVTYVATRPQWHVALGALDRMLERQP